jgi:hypothetical protein
MGGIRRFPDQYYWPLLTPLRVGPAQRAFLQQVDEEIVRQVLRVLPGTKAPKQRRS